MTDLHTHILPGIDDGSKNVKESKAMISALAEQGVDRIVLTPHFYANQNSPEEFLEKRALAAEKLMNGMDDTGIRFHLGAEVLFFEGITGVSSISALKIEKTDLLLVEMPFSAWSDRQIRELYELADTGEFTVVLAHIERYLAYQKKELPEEFKEHGIRIQSNASFFIGWMNRLRSVKFLKNGFIDFIGTDCHNMSSRPPRYDEAYKAVLKSGKDTEIRLKKTDRYYFGD